ncbi:hypothetical protein B0H10DRAFT_2362241 [Mycena sp. CBHHK59/15]|nr:hypothetical protein B0H10DRAFT_2362241 [Mycena sp. CBHHK59/15]
MISAASQFCETRPCTNVPIKCPAADCDQFHWKYNFQQHLEDRHPQWRLILSHDFLSAIQISSAEQQASEFPTTMSLTFRRLHHPIPPFLLRVTARSSPHRALRVRPAAEPTRRTKG